MVLARGALAIGLLLLWVYALLSAITADATRVRNLPKPVWIAIVLLLPLVGSVLWLVAGRPKAPPRTVTRDSGTSSRVPPEYDRPGRAVASNPDDDAAFLEQVRLRAEEQRRKAIEEQQRRKDEGGQAPPA